MSNAIENFDIDKSKIAKAVLLPGIIPRLKDLFTSPLIFLAYGYAYLFSLVRLLPENHPYLQKQNFGKYGLFQVLGAASEKIEFNLQNIDRVIAYFAVIASLFIMMILGVLSLLFIVLNSAWAQNPVPPANLAALISTPAPANDIALMMLDATFGIPGIYNSSMMPATPSAFHGAMQNGIFGVYNAMFLVIGVVIMCIHVMHVIFDTIQSGTLFGQRFNSFWGPLRLLLGVGLLLPVNYNMNSAQYVALYTAKFGSGLATNAWTSLTSRTPVPIGGVDVTAGAYRNLISAPSVPDINALVGFMHLVKVCEYFYENLNNGRPDDKQIDAYQIYYNNAVLMPGNYGTAVTNTDGQAITIRFGEQNSESGQIGNIDPLCGEVTINVVNGLAPGANAAYEGHYNLLRAIYDGAGAAFSPILAFSEHINKLHVKNFGGCPLANTYNAAGTCDDEIPSQYPHYFYQPGSPTQMASQAIVTSAVAELSTATELDYGVTLASRGWAGAGLWYGRVTDLNGTMTEAVMSIPSATKMPLILQNLIDKRMQNDQDVSAADLFDDKNGEGEAIKNLGLQVDGEEQLLKVLNETYRIMLGPESSLQQDTTNNASAMSSIESILNMIFGTSGLANMIENRDTHAMFQLTAVGKGLIETSIRNLLTSTIASAGGGLLSQLDSPAAKIMGNVTSAVASLSATIGQITLTAGIILFYIVPLMPFMYFFFACGRWVKSVFEALVGAPLWALGHLKYDGEGLGDMAISGYYLLFEIFIRPILIVFGLIAGLSIFGAMVTVLNDIFTIVTTNLSGFEHNTATADLDVESARGRIDQFFFTLFYVVVVYMMAQSAFKLIDMIPNQILRWMGSSTSSFGDMAQDPMENLTQTAAISGAQMVPQATGALSRAGAGLGTIGGQGLNAAIKK